MKFTDKQILDWLSRPTGRKLLTPTGPDGIFAYRRYATIETTHGVRDMGDTLREAISRAMKAEALAKKLAKKPKP